MHVFWWSLIIFFSRVADVGMGTIRVQLIVSGRKYLAALISFVEILIYIVIVSRVIQDIDNWAYVLAYAAGFSVGTLVGIILAERMRRGVVQATIIPHGPWEDVEEAVRKAGFALTRQPGVGREGYVSILHVVCAGKSLPRLLEVVAQVDAKAFVYTQELVGLRGGHIYGLKSKL